MARQITDGDLAEKMADFYDDPASFVMFAFPWGEKGTPLARFPHGPDEWHLALFSAMAEHVKENIKRMQEGKPAKPWRSSIASGHGIGKSACVAWLIIWIMSTRPWCRGVVTANTAEQLQTKTWPELAKWHQMAINSHWFKWTATQFYFAKCSEDKRKNYCFDAVTWSEERTEGFAGLHNASGAVCIIFDEASAIPDKLLEVAQGAMTDGEPWLFAFGNPTRNDGWFFETFHSLTKLWWNLNVDSREVRITNKEYIAELVDQYGEESDYIRVRVRGLFPTVGDTQFIPSDLVASAMLRRPHVEKGNALDQAPLVLGIDVARFGEDMTVFCFRKGQDAQSIKIQKFRSLDTMQIATMAAEHIMLWNPDYVFVDGVGVGGGVVDRLRQLGFRVMDVNGGGRPTHVDRYSNKRAEMWGEMRNWLRDGGCLPKDDELKSELIGPQYSFTTKHQIKLERKEDMKKRGLRSPNIADALALTFASPTAYRDLSSSRYRHRRTRAKGVDYDLFGRR